MGENDDIAIKSLEDDLDLIASKTVNCSCFSKKFVKNGNHNYEQQEKQFAKIVVDWIKKGFKGLK